VGTRISYRVFYTAGCQKGRFMKKKLIIPLVIALMSETFFLVRAMPQEAGQETKIEKSVCLACHGTFDEIAAATADYVAPSGETVSPHRYVPHAEKTDIPECIECHKPHPIPPEPKEEAAESEEPANPANIDWCYNSCHHVRNLQPCSACH
jgi:hypothetical protein